MIIGITGNPGVGKHTIAENLKKITKTSVIIDINKLIIDNKIFANSNSIEQEIDLFKAKSALRSKLQENCKKRKIVIIVGHLLPYIVDPLDIDLVVVLRKSPYKLMSIFNDRGYSLKKSKENAASEILGICFYDALTVFTEKKIVAEIDTTSQTPMKIVQKIMELLYTKKQNIENIDWMELIHKKNDLKYFFEY